VIKEILFKWLGVTPIPCSTCEILRSLLDESIKERRELTARIVAHSEPLPLAKEKEEERPPVPIQPTFIPWRVRQQMLEEEDRKQAQVIRAKQNELAEQNRLMTNANKSVEELEEELKIR
jgi:hypothetical protein